MENGKSMPMQKIVSRANKDGLVKLFYQKLLIYANDNPEQRISPEIDRKLLNKKFSLLFLTREQTSQVLKILQAKGLVEIKKSSVLVK